MSKPIRVFWSPLSQRFYASRAYKQIRPGVVEITGEMFDVTGDIAEQVIKHQIEFWKAPEPEAGKLMQPNSSRKGTPHEDIHQITVACIAPPACRPVKKAGE